MFARPVSDPGTEFRPSAVVPASVCTVTHAVVMGGMPCWQIALIAAGAALVDRLHGDTEAPKMSEDGAARFTGQADTDVVHAGPLVIDLVMRARGGDQRSWDALVKRYAPLIWSICRGYRLSRADAEDVGQSVWLRLAGQLGKVRDPAALPGWLATTTRRECGRILRAACRPHAPACGLDAENLPAEQDTGAEQELLEAERHVALREAFTHLPPDGQRLIALLLADPPLPYAEISARLGIPVGSIGPTRSRCLAKLRRYPPIAALIDSDTNSLENH